MVNKVILVGNLGADPEIKYTQAGDPVANMRLATSESWTKDGERQEQTEWHRVVAFKRLAEICGEYLRKGSRIYVEGKIQTRKWEDRDGNDKYTTEVIAREMKMLGEKRQESDHNCGEGGRDNTDKYDHPNPTGDDVPF